MSEFLTLVISGAVSGAIFAIMASGLVLTYTTSGIFNFAHGAVAFVVAYVYFQLRESQGMSSTLAAAVSVLVVAPLLGLALDRILLRRLAAAPVHARIVGSVGLLVALPNIALWSVDQINLHGGTLAVPDQYNSRTGIGPKPADVYRLTKTLVINSDQVAVLIASAAAALLLWFVLRHTRNSV